MSAGARMIGVSAGYTGGHPVLQDVHLDVEPGELVAVLGPSGSGKTTLIRVLAGLHPVRAGRVEMDGVDVTTLPPERRRVGLVPQDGALFPNRSVAANIAYGLRGVRARRSVSEPRVLELLELTGLGGLAERMPHELSGGQQQRVALARALAPSPRLVLLDEPFSALDAALREQLREEVAELLRGSGVGALLVTHDQDEALTLSDRVAIVRDGVLVQSGSPVEVYQRPRDAWTAGFLGTAMLVPGRRRPDGVHTALGTVQTQRAGAPPEQEECTVLVRPEQLRLVASGTPNAIDAVVRRLRFQGPSTLVDVEPTGAGAAPCPERLLIRVQPPTPLTVGDRVAVAVDGELHELPGSEGTAHAAATSNARRPRLSR